MLAHHDVAVGDQVLLVQRLLRGQVGLDGHVALGAEDLHPLVCRAFLQALEDAVARELGGLRRPALGIVLEALVGEQLADQVRRLEERVEEVLHEVAALQPLPVAGHHRVVVERGHATADHGDVAVHLGLARQQLRDGHAQQVEGQHRLQQARLHVARLAPGKAREQ